MKPLFVYGTLLEGGPAAALVGPAPRRPATVRGTLYQLPAGYPALALRGNGLVHGELVELADPAVLRVLDHYEGVDDGLYQRVEVEAVVGLRRVPAWAWVQDDPRLRGGRPLPSGRWLHPRRR